LRLFAGYIYNYFYIAVPLLTDFLLQTPDFSFEFLVFDHFTLEKACCDAYFFLRPFGCQIIGIGPLVIAGLEVAGLDEPLSTNARRQ